MENRPRATTGLRGDSLYRNAAHTSTRTVPSRESEVMVPSGATDSVRTPASTPTTGSPNRCASGGARKIPSVPLAVTVTEPSGARAWDHPSGTGAVPNRVICVRWYACPTADRRPDLQR